MSHDHYADVIEAAENCAIACSHCASACLNEDDVEDLAECIRLDLDCAELCRVLSALMSRGSRFSKEMCRVCAVAAEACARECERQVDLPHCRICAEVCRRCADMCRAFASAEQRIPVSA